MLGDTFTTMIAFIRNWSSTAIFKLFYEEGYVDLYIYDDKIKKVRKVSVPTIKEIIKSSVGIDDILIGSYISGEELQKYDLVYFNDVDFKVYKASNTSKNRATALGIVLSDVKQDQPVQVKSTGIITFDYDLPYNVGDVLYLGENGRFTNQIPEVGKYITKVGKVVSYRKIDLSISQPIYNGG